MAEGQFLCPQCAANKNYKHKKVTRFFTLYFIPIIPLGQAGEFVECQTCRGTFVSRVLEYDAAKNNNDFQSQYEKAMRHSMILMMLADGHIDDEEVTMVQKIINKFGHNDITENELHDLIDEVESKNEPIQKYLSNIAPSLNEHGKEIIIKCGLAVASADGNIDESELSLLRAMSQAMEMSPSHVKGILQDITSKEPAFSEN